MDLQSQDPWRELESFITPERLAHFGALLHKRMRQQWPEIPVTIRFVPFHDAYEVLVGLNGKAFFGPMVSSITLEWAISLDAVAEVTFEQFWRGPDLWIDRSEDSRRALYEQLFGFDAYYSPLSSPA